MFGASSMALRGVDLTLGIHKTADKVSILEINFVHLVLAKMA